jgi:hypothetical protein
MNATHPNSNSREYQRQTIDAQIKSLEDSIRALRLQRNALAPISSLPPEIIAAIFSFLPHMLSATTPPKRPDPLAWLRYSHVCHQWREIALNQPLLWSHVDFANISWAGAAKILARAKLVPLYLEARFLGDHWDNAQFSAFQEELQFHVSHIRHLLISANRQSLHKALEGLVSPAPTLESLSLSGERKQPRTVVPATLFGGMRPRLSSLELSKCDISWKSSLLKGLRCLEMRSPSADMRPSLSVWLDALAEMQQLKMLTLHSASPIAPRVPFDVSRTVTLPLLTHLDISSSSKYCALALAHFDLPSLTSLCLKAIIHFPLEHNDDVQKLLTYVARHAHGPQDTQPLQSALVFNRGKYIDILAWTVPDIDVDVHDPLTLISTTLPTRVALSFKSNDWYAIRGARTETIWKAMSALPLDSLATLILKDSMPGPGEVWLPNAPKWPLLRRVRLIRNAAYEFSDWLLADKGGCENPLLPSLKELVLVECYFFKFCDTLMMRVEQGVPLEMLDLRTCYTNRDYSAAVRLLSEIVVDVLGPEEADEARSQIISTWDGLTCGPFVGHESYDNADESDTDDEN